MLIGLTYDLRDEYLAAGYSEEETAEFDRADTIDAIDDALQSLGHDTDRIGHARQLFHDWPTAIVGIWCSTSAKVCMALGGKLRFRPFWMCSRSPTPFPIPVSCRSAWTRA